MILQKRLRYPISLRYKLALPVSVSVFLILILLTHTTIRVIRDFVVEAFEMRIASQVETFAELIRPYLVLQDLDSLRPRLEGLAAREEVYGVRLLDREGKLLLQAPPGQEFPFIPKNFVGVRSLYSYQSLAAILLRLEALVAERRFRKYPDLFIAAAQIHRGPRVLGSVQIFFKADNVNEMIRKIYRQRILFSVLSALGIALLTSTVTWLAIRPLFRLGETVQEILKGKTEARAKIRTGDEIEALAGAFNEMVNRLQETMNHLRSRSEALEESEGRYRALVENATDVIWLLSPEGKILFLNQGFAGISRDDLLKEGLPLFLSFNSEESIEKFQTAFQQVKEEKARAYHLLTVFHHPQTRNEIFYSSNLTPVLTRGGELKAIQATTRDVTELKRIEMMKDRLIRDVAHELKTPVAKFQMTLAWLEKELQEEPEGKRYQEVLGLMKRNADLLMKIIMEIMDLSRLEFGAERLTRKPCNLNEILSRVCEDLQPLVEEKKLKLELRLCPGPLRFEGDEAMLYRLFSNLVVNSLKFTPQGKIIVTSNKNEDTLLATVQDTGVGLEKEDLDKVFDRFYQKSPATIGMGLGLALAREIVVLHGGRIWAESGGIGKGSTFLVEFPQ